MKASIRKSIIAAVLILAFLFGFSSNLFRADRAQAVTQEEIDKLKEKSSALTGQKNELQSKIDALESESLSALAKKAIIDQQIMLTEAQIDNINEQIAAYDLLIEQKAQEVTEAKNREEEQLRQYRERVRIMEENGTVSYISVLFEADSFSDLLSRLDFIHAVMNYDEELYKDYIQAKEETTAAKEALEETRAEQEEAREELEEKEAELQDELEKAAEYIQELRDNIETSEAYYAELDALQAEVDKEIQEKVAELQRQREEEERRRKAEEARKKAIADAERAAAEEARRKAEEEARKKAAEEGGESGSEESSSSSTVSSSSYANGYFIWPCPSCYIVTSNYGTRIHPIYNTSRWHNGIDIGAGYGANILASDGGKVISAYYHWSYGNMVLIDHGNGYQTLYAHMSRIGVSVGDYVSQGSVIGYVGSTGDSTGPHCHFEIRYQGGSCDPNGFLSRYSYTIWDD